MPRDGLTVPALGLGHLFRVVVVVRQRLVDVGDVEVVARGDRSRVEAPSVDPVADEPDGESPAVYLRPVVDVRVVTCVDREAVLDLPPRSLEYGVSSIGVDDRRDLVSPARCSDVQAWRAYSRKTRSSRSSKVGFLSTSSGTIAVQSSPRSPAAHSANRSSSRAAFRR